MNKDKEYYFVYGTLKKGFYNNSILEDSPTAEFVKEIMTEPKYTMIDLGAFPGVIENGETSIIGELWSVSDDQTKRRLDMLEGYVPNRIGNLYNKKVISMDDKNINIYIYNTNKYSSNKRIIESGVWKSRY